MLPLIAEVTNFSSYKHETIDFTKFNNIFLVLGENGAGKSSMIDIITTAIFFRCHGVDSRGAGMDDLIHKKENSFKIDFTFSMNNHVYRIIREKIRNKGQNLSLYIDDNDFTGKLQETQQRIYDIFKMDYDTFMDTIIIGQNESAGFIKKSATERKKIIAQILRLDKYDVLESYTKDTKKQFENEIANLDLNMNKLYDSIKNKENYINELDTLKCEIQTLENGVKSKEAELEKELIEKTKFEELKKQQDSIINRKRNIETNLNNFKLELNKLETIKQQMSQVISKKDSTTNSINLLNDSISKLTSEEKEITNNKTILETQNSVMETKLVDLKNQFKQLKNYNDCNCKFCGQKITPEHKERHLQELKNQGCAEQQKINSNTITIGEYKKRMEAIIAEMNNKNSELRQLMELNNKIQMAEVKIENVVSKITDTNTRIVELIKEQEEIQKIDLDALEYKVFNDSTIRYELQQMRNSLSTKTSRIALLNNQLSIIEQNEVEYEQNKDEYNAKKEQIDIYAELQKSWGKKGIQSIIIENILPQIEEEINKYLAILSSNRISIKFQTEKEAKNGNKSETLDIIVKDSNGERPYERYSGGEKTRINFACHIGMSKFLAKRSGATIDFFIIDEGIGTLDDNGKDDFVETIRLLTLIFKKVMIISHIPDIKEAFNNKVLVTKTLEDGSKVNIMH